MTDLWFQPFEEPRSKLAAFNVMRGPPSTVGPQLQPGGPKGGPQHINEDIAKPNA